MSSDRVQSSTLRNALTVSVALHLLAVIIIALFLSNAKNDYEDYMDVDIIPFTKSVTTRRAVLRSRTPPSPYIQRSLDVTSSNFIFPDTAKNIPIRLTSEVQNIAMFPNFDDALAVGNIAVNISASEYGFSTSNFTHRPFSKHTQNFHQRSISRQRESQSKNPMFARNSVLMTDVSSLPQPDAPLEKIARHLLATRHLDMIDIVFIVDASQSMSDNIKAVTNHLSQMTDMFHAEQLDFTIGVMTFRKGTMYSLLGWDVTITPQTKNIQQIKQSLYSIRCRGGEQALDALMQAMVEIKFRPGAERHFILVTDEYVSGSYSSAEVLHHIQQSGIIVSVIGLDEPFQKRVAQRTGGMWLSITKIDG